MIALSRVSCLRYACSDCRTVVSGWLDAESCWQRHESMLCGHEAASSVSGCTASSRLAATASRNVSKVVVCCAPLSLPSPRSWAAFTLSSAFALFAPSSNAHHHLQLFQRRLHQSIMPPVAMPAGSGGMAGPSTFDKGKAMLKNIHDSTRSHRS